MSALSVVSIGKHRRGEVLGLAVGDQVLTASKIAALTGLHRASIIKRLRKAFAGEIEPNEVLGCSERIGAGKPAHWRPTMAHAECFSEIERLAFCRPWR